MFFFCFGSAAIVIGAFLGCYLPIVVASLVHIFAGQTTGCSLARTLEILLFLTFSNTVLNPLIYSLRNNEYRRAFQKTFRRCHRESNNNQGLRVSYVKQDLESLTVSSHVTSNHVNTSWCFEEDFIHNTQCQNLKLFLWNSLLFTTHFTMLFEHTMLTMLRIDYFTAFS